MDNNNTIFNTPIEEYKRQAEFANTKLEHEANTPINLEETLEASRRGLIKLKSSPELSEIVHVAIGVDMNEQ